MNQLIKTTGFEKISVQQLAEAAGINRVTFYDHYNDKFALLEGMVAARFDELLAERGVKFDCTTALQGIILAVCDFLSDTVCESQRQLDLYLQAAVLTVVREMLLEGLRKHSTAVAPELVAMTVSGAVCGAAREWLRLPDRGTSEQAVPVIAGLIAPIFSSL